MAGAGLLPKAGADHFWRALLMAAAIECAVLAALMLRPPAAVAPVQPTVVKLHMVQPAAVPKAKPPPPKPPPPVPQPVTPPLPAPPPVPPARPDHPVLRSHPRPVVPTPPPPPLTPVLPPAPVAAAPPPSPLQAQTLLARYTALLRGIILSHVVNPEELVDEGVAGTCTLRFTVTPAGVIVGVSVLVPSSIAAVNQAALAAVRNSGFPAFLAEMPDHALDFTIQVHVGSDN